MTHRDGATPAAEPIHESCMIRIRSTHRRAGAALAALAGVLVLGLTAPIPAVSDDARETVVQEVRTRLPGWTIHRVARSWEGAYTVVMQCAGREVGFQLIPGHGLPAEDAWVQPNDAYSRERLAAVSDHWRHLVWYENPAAMSSLSCEDELAADRTRPEVSRFE